MAKSKDARYPNANAVIHELSEAIGQAIPPETAATRESFIQAARLVGRQTELKQLADAFQEALNGSGSAWLIGGESGVGKSRLVDEIRALAMTRGALVLRGQGISEGGSPYHLWRPALRWLCLLTELDDTKLSVLQTLVPDMNTLLGRDIPDAPPLAHKAAQNRLLNVIEDLFRRQRQPIVIVLEDLHWAQESLDVLRRLSHIVSDLPLFIVGSYRDDEKPELPAHLPGMRVMKLERLSADEIAELSTAMLGESGKRETVVDLLQRETEGNVLFLVEVVRYLAEEAGQLERIGLATLPAQLFVGGVQKVIQRRLHHLPADTLPLLRFAATMGRQFDLAVLRAADLYPNLDEWLTICSDAAVLEVQDDAWRFAHDKLRDGILGGLSPDEQRALHQHVAETLEIAYPDLLPQAALLAYHYARAGNRYREEHFATLAGEQALSTGAYQDAVRFLSRALEIVHDVEGSRVGILKSALKRREIDLKSQLAEAHLGKGDYQLAELLYGENLVACQEIQYFKGLADTLDSLGNIALALMQFEPAKAYYRDALGIYQELDDPDGMTRALNNLGNVAYETDDVEEAKRLYQQSLSLSRGAGGGWGMAGAISSKETGEFASVGGYAMADQTFHESLAAYHHDAGRSRLVEACQKLLAATHIPDEFSHSRQLFQAGCDQFQQKGDAWGAALMLAYLGRTACAAKDFTNARQHLYTALKQAADQKEMGLTLDILVAIGRLFAQQGPHGEALQLLSLAVHHPDSADHTQDEAERLLFELENEFDRSLIAEHWEKGKSRVLDATIAGLLASDLLAKQA
jgi:tetratricopeptide (TPR) repeat protein